jgi:hypothetical protein
MNSTGTTGALHYLLTSLSMLADDIFLYQVCQPKMETLSRWTFHYFEDIMTGKGVSSLEQLPEEFRLWE